MALAGLSENLVNVDESLKKSLLELLAAFACIDGELHPFEREFLEYLSERHFGGKDAVLPFMENYEGKSAEYSFKKCGELIRIIQDEDARLEVLDLLSQVADADRRFHSNEKRFLELVKENWKIDASFISASIELDNNQRGIAEAPVDWKMYVEAGPGSGKTAVACARVAALCDQGVEPSSIWLVSFTRAAVQEARDRIEFFVDEPESLMGIQIATLDNRAWNLRKGFIDEDINFSELWEEGFDTNIQRAREVVEENRIEIEDFLEGLEHVIIDEAQDIVGARAVFLDSVLKLLPRNCGVTIFGDPAQAIYGFTVDNNGKGEKDMVTFIDLFHKRFEDIGDFELGKNYRSENLDLVDMVGKMRKEILSHIVPGEEKLQDAQDLIDKHAKKLDERFIPDAVRDMDNLLILFRRRAEVLTAANFCASAGVPYKLRMSGTPQLCHAWLAVVLNKCENDTILKDDFDELWNQSILDCPGGPSGSFDAWSILQRATGARPSEEHLRIDRLRQVGSGRPTPLIACNDPGFGGPIIGTIHASKGREAYQVHLRARADGPVENSESEARVLFVGASRAKARLSVGDGFLKANYASTIESGRTYLRQTSRYGGLAYSVEIGRDQDVNPYSFVSRKEHLDGEHVFSFQKHLVSVLTEKTPVGIWLDLMFEPHKSRVPHYKIWMCTENSEQPVWRVVGEMSDKFNSDLFAIIEKEKPEERQLYRLPKKIKYLFVFGVATYFAREDDPHLVQVHEPFASRGYWMVPVIGGFPVTYFQRRRGH